MHTKKTITSGKELSKGGKALILLHGRGASAENILDLSNHLNVKDYALIAVEATNNTWYPYSFLASPDQNEPWLSSAINVLDEIVSDINEAGVTSEDIFFLGFSQGACLSLEYVTSRARKWGGVIAFTGGLIGDKIYNDKYKGDFHGTPVFIGTSDPDPHVPVERVHATVNIMKSMNAVVTEKIYPSMGHTISKDEIDMANKLIFN